MAKPSSAIPSREKLEKTLIPQLKQYVLTDKLGSGSYSTVYKAFNKTGVRNVVAVKCITKSNLNKASTENLLTEIELLKTLKHKHIVNLQDFMWDDHYIFMVMEFCGGGDLSHFIHSHRTVSEGIVRKFLQQIALAMEYLQSNNVAHMDLKPQNILLTSSPHPIIKIADFGFAKPLYDGDVLHIMRGSPLYMAPEIICQMSYDARVDLWSIGIILYGSKAQCLFGSAPFASSNFKELGERIFDTKPIMLPACVRVSEDCRNLLLRLLQRNPDARISFEDFFNHPFVDLLHSPSPQCILNAKMFVADAVQKDSDGDYKTAVQLYSNAIAFFMPAIYYEIEPARKQALRLKAHQYMERAEELKRMLKPMAVQPTDMLTSHCSDGENAGSDDPFHPDDGLEMQAAKRLIRTAIKEEENEQYSEALKHYEMALGAMIKLLTSEGIDRHQSQLRQQVNSWMSRAEAIKAYLAVQKISVANTDESTSEEEDTSASTLS